MSRPTIAWIVTFLCMLFSAGTCDRLSGEVRFDMYQRVKFLAVVLGCLAFLTTTTQAAPDQHLPPYKLPAGATLVPQPCPTDNYPSVYSLALIGGSSILVSAGGGKQLTVWNIQTGRLLKEISDVDPDGPIAASPAGAVVAAASSGTIKLWDIETGQPLRPFAQPTPHGVTTALAFDSTGRLLISSDVDGTSVSAATQPPGAVRLWDSLEGKLIRTFGNQYDVDTVAFSPDGRLALAAGQFVNVWDVATGALIQSFDTHHSEFGAPLSAVFSPDSSYVVSGGHSALSGDPALTLWDLKTGQQLKTIGSKITIHPVAFTADKKSLLAIQGHDRLQLWDVATWSPTKTFGNGNGNYGNFTPSSNALLTADGSISVISSACTLQVWKMDGALAETLVYPNNGWAAFTPDGWFVSSGDATKQFKLLQNNRSLAIGTLAQKNRLDTLAAITGISAGSSSPKNCQDSNFPLGKLICDDGRLGEKPAQITDASAYFTVLQTAQSAAEAQRRVMSLMTRFPYARFSVFPPYPDENKWIIVVASYADLDHARQAYELARRLGIAGDDSYVWKIPNPSTVPTDWAPDNIQQIVMKCLAKGMQTIVQMYTCSGSVLTPALLESCIKDGVCELDQTPLAAAQLLESQNLTWNSQLLVQVQQPDMNAVHSCFDAHSNDPNQFLQCTADSTLGTMPAATCRDKVQNDRALAECILQAAGLSVDQLDCLMKKSRTDPSSCLDTANSPQWLQAKQCLAQQAQQQDAFKAVASCLLRDVDPKAVDLAKCLSNADGKALDGLSCAAQWPALGNQVKAVQCLKGIEDGKSALARCAGVVGIHLDPTVLTCLQSATTNASNLVSQCFPGATNPAVSCFANFSGSTEDIMTCLANGNAATRDALAAVRCITSGNDASDLIVSCTEGLVKDPKSRQALACAARSNGDIASLAGCAAAPLLGGDGSRLLTCATQSQSYTAFALCAAGPKMNPEWTIAAQCAASSGGVPVTTAACTAGWLTLREFGKCFEKGFGGDGCFGPDNSIVKAVSNAIHDITKGPGPNNDIVKAIRAIGEKTEIKDVSLRTPLGGREAFLPKAGRDFDQGRIKAQKWLGARLGIH
jgi:WD40 repeat protein